MLRLQLSPHQVVALNAGCRAGKSPLDCDNRNVRILQDTSVLQIRAEEDDPCHPVSSALLDIFRELALPVLRVEEKKLISPPARLHLHLTDHCSKVWMADMGHNEPENIRLLF